jgi:hypothetical protein
LPQYSVIPHGESLEDGVTESVARHGWKYCEITATLNGETRMIIAGNADLWKLITKSYLSPAELTPSAGYLGTKTKRASIQI